MAATPAVLLALAEFGVERALLVVAGITLINVLAENVLSPMSMCRGLSPTVVFVSFVFWTWLLGGPGAFLALPLFVVVMLDTFPETRWVANVVGIVGPEVDDPAGSEAGIEPAKEGEQP